MKVLRNVEKKRSIIVPQKLQDFDDLIADSKSIDSPPVLLTPQKQSTVKRKIPQNASNTGNLNVSLLEV